MKRNLSLTQCTKEAARYNSMSVLKILASMANKHSITYRKGHQGAHDDKKAQGINNELPPNGF